MAKRSILVLDVQSSAKEAIESECGRTGMSQRELSKRLFEWFAAQDEVIRGSILGTLPPSVAVDVSKLDPGRLAKPRK